MTSYLPHHALICDNSNCEVVNRHAVTLPAHNLGSHISRGPAGLFGVLGVPYPGDAEIGHSQIALVVKDQVFGFDVPVYDALAVDIFQGHCNACHKKPGLVLCELSVFRNVIAEVTPG